MFFTAADATPELRHGNFQGLTLDKNGLIAVGKVQCSHLHLVTDD